MDIIPEAEDLPRLLDNTPRITRSTHDVYLNRNQLVYINKQCDQQTSPAPFFIHVTPVDEAELPGGQRQAGFENLGLNWGDACIAIQYLPAYDIAHIRTGQYLPDSLQLWAATIRLDFDAAWLTDVLDHTAPVVQDAFTVYHHANRLLYTYTGYTEPTCQADTLDPLFFVHIIPVNAADLPAAHRQHSMGIHDFRFQDRQLPLAFYFQDQPPPGQVQCAALLDLPAYPIARIRTGQFTPAGPQLWASKFEPGKPTP